jgi:AcrR family transcriptional regulator
VYNKGTSLVKLYDFGQMTSYERRRSSTKQRIIEATLETLIERGYSRLTISEIAERADIGRGTFYRYFEDVDAVLLCLFAQQYEQVQVDVDAVMLHYESPERERQAWKLSFSYFASFYDVFSKLRGEDSNAVWEKFEQYTTERFVISLQKGNFSYAEWMGLPVDVMAYFTAGAVMAVVRRWLSGELPYESEAMAEMVYKLLYHRPG